MGRVWFTDYPHIGLDIPPVTIVTPRIITAYFAKKVVTAGATATAASTIAFETINEGILGRDVYIIVETSDFVPFEDILQSTNRANVVLQLKTADCNLTGTEDETLNVTDGTADVTSFTKAVGDTSALDDADGNCNYANLSDFVDKAIFKITLRPNERTNFSSWAEQIEIAGTDLPKIELHVAPEDERIVFAYGAEGSGQPQNGMFANTVGKDFKLKPSCSCDGFKIENGLLLGENIIYKHPKSKVKASGELKTPKAIVLHRTVGTTITGAISHSKGTHFYVAGQRENDGEIYQAMSLKNSSNHIFDTKVRIARLDIKTNNSIGIEVIGIAYTLEKGILTSCYGDVMPKETPITKGYTDINKNTFYWDKLTDEQIKSVACIVKQLMEEYNLTKKDILTHEGLQMKTAGEGQAVFDAIKPFL